VSVTYAAGHSKNAVSKAIGDLQIEIIRESQTNLLWSDVISRVPPQTHRAPLMSESFWMLIPMADRTGLREPVKQVVA